MQRVQIDLDSEAQLAAAGFMHIQGGTSTFANGLLALETAGYEEWSQQRGFVDLAANGPWAVEIRMSMDTPCAKAGTGLWIHDRQYYTRLAITDNEVVLNGERAEIGPTNRMRTYRVEYARDHLRVRVDGNVELEAPARENGATITLMFGVLGDGCAVNRSTWDHIAYETTSGDAIAWPPRYAWHPATTEVDLVAAIHAALPTTAARIGGLDRRDVPCLAMLLLDGAVREILPLAYAAQGTPLAADDLRALSALTNTQVLAEADHLLGRWMDLHQLPACDPRPGMPCGARPPPAPAAPIPAIGTAVRDAVTHARSWSANPDHAVRSTKLAARVFADAVAARLPDASIVLHRLELRLAALRDHPRRCGL